MFRGTKSPSPASSNYDFSLRHERVKLFARVLKQFDANITRTVQAMREVAGSLSTVGESYHEVAQCVNNTNPRSAMNRPYQMSNANSNRVVENYGTGLQSAATVFAKAMTSLREGEQYVTFNGSVHQSVLVRLHDVITRAKKTAELGDDVATALRKSVAARKVAQKKELKYTRLGKPLTESKRYAKQAEEMRQREQTYEAKLRAFDTEYEGLMQRQLYVAGHTMDDFLDANTVYLAQMLKVLSCLAPHGADAVENMVQASQDLGNRLGIAPEEQVASRFQARGGDMGNPSEASHFATPVKTSPAKTSCGSSHNFTSYYRNRKHRGASADRAPPTARALDDSENETAPTNGWSSPGTPQPPTFSSRSPQGRHTNVSEPDPSPPTPCPNPIARLTAAQRRETSTSTVAAGAAASANTAAAAAAPMPVVPRSGGAVIAKTGKRIAAASARPPTNTTADASRMPPSPPAAAVPDNAERSITRSPARAPFGDGNTPAFHQPCDVQHRQPSPTAAVPATALSNARSPSGPVPASQQRRAAALQAQAALLGLDRARSTEPYEDDCPKGVVSYTPRTSLQPVSLLAAMDAEADQPSEVGRRGQPQPSRHANPLALPTAISSHPPPQGYPHQQPPQQQQQQTRKTSKKSKAALPSHGPVLIPPAAAAHARGPTVLAASAPPPDDATLSSSTNSAFLGESNANSLLQGSLSLQHHRATVSSNALSLTIPAGMQKAYDPNGDASETETGGVSGRSHALSTSYALDSPAFAPHLRGMEARSWEDSHHVRPCSPA